jgi:hypothetical protein
MHGLRHQSTTARSERKFRLIASAIAVHNRDGIRPRTYVPRRTLRLLRRAGRDPELQGHAVSRAYRRDIKIVDAAPEFDRVG